MSRITQIIGKLIPDSLKQEFKIKLGAPHVYWSIRNLRNNGLKGTHFVDIGAYHGEFTEAMIKLFPGAAHLMLEANPAKAEQLTAFTKRFPSENIRFEIALLDSEPREKARFHVMETASSALDEIADQGGTTIEVPSFTLDQILEKYQWPEISLMKLDVQGFELEILKGGKKSLELAEAVLLEVSLLDIHKNVPLLHEVTAFMYQYGFVAYDICSVSARRPLDRALWQTDILFVKEQSIYRNNKRYS